jgi:hypothetical protein
MTLQRRLRRRRAHEGDELSRSASVRAGGDDGDRIAPGVSVGTVKATRTVSASSAASVA